MSSFRIGALACLACAACNPESSIDAGPALDAGADADGGAELDAGSAADAGPANDGGALVDGGVDAGLVLDGGASLDAGMRPTVSPIAAGTPLSSGTLIAHGLGGIDGLDKTNTREAFEESLAEGKIWYEVDLKLTSDGVVVCFHRDRVGNIARSGDPPGMTIEQMTSADFLSRTYLPDAGGYTLLTFDDLLTLMDANPQVRLITDTRAWTEALATAIGADIAAHPASASHVVPQIYFPCFDTGVIEQHVSCEPDLLAAQRALGWPWEFSILSLYVWHGGVGGDGSIARNAALNALPSLPDVGALVMWDFMIVPGLGDQVHDGGRVLGVHPANDEALVRGFLDAGVDAFYTDLLLGPTL